MLTCKEVVELVTDYLEGRMSLLERAGFHLHLGMCRHCRAYLRQMKLTIRTVGALPKESVPEPVMNELLQRFRAVSPARSYSIAPRTEGHGGMWQWLVALTLLALSLALGLRATTWTGGVLDGGLNCVFSEAIAGVVISAAAFGIARWRAFQGFSASTLAMGSTAGAFAVFLFLSSTCPMTRSAPHVLVMHVGGVALALAFGAILGRAPVLRRGL